MTMARTAPPRNSLRTLTRGGDCEILDTEEDIEAAVIYVIEAQNRKDKDSPP